MAAIEDSLAALLFLVRPMAAAWAKFGPQLEARLDNRVARWRAGKAPNEQ